jgi:hypothetical protein
LVSASLLLHLLLLVALFFFFGLYKTAWIKFLVIALSPIHVLVAQGVYQAGERTAALLAGLLRAARTRPAFVRWATSVGLLLVLSWLTYPSLHNLYLDPAYARDDYRQLSADIRAQHQSGDAIVLNAPNQWEVFTYYYADEAVYPAPYRPTATKAASFLEPILEQHERLFVLYWGDAESDPQKRVESWLAKNAYKAGDRWYGDVRLATYGVGPLADEAEVGLDARFGHDIRLLGFSVEDQTLAPGTILPVTLFWRAEGAIDRPYKVTLQLLDGQGSLVAQTDTQPRDGLAPTTSWQPGEELVDRYGILVPADRPPGRYRLIVAVYDAASGERLAVLADDQREGDHLLVSKVVVKANR